MSDANEQTQESYLKISSPSFSLELEGNPTFIMQSYDMVREDVLRRLMELIQKAPQQIPQQPSSQELPSAPLAENLATEYIEPVIDAQDPSAFNESAAVDEKALTSIDLQLPPEVTGRPASNFRAAPPGPSRSNNMRDIKARMASKQPTSRPSIPAATPPTTATEPTPSSQSGAQQQPAQASQQQPPQPQPIQSAQLNTQASIQVDIPTPATSKATPKATPKANAQPTSVSPERASKSHYIWIYITHQAYNKVYVADLSVFEKSPASAFLDGRRVRKMHLESVALAAFKPLFGEGHTMWAEPSPTRSKNPK